MQGKILGFFDGIEDNSAFGFVLDERHGFVPAGKPGYRLYTGEAYPFVVLADELLALNQYACETARAVRNYVAERESSFAEWEALSEDSCSRLGCRKTELLLGCEQEQTLCEQLTHQAAGQLLCLLYSFLERALKLLRRELFAGQAGQRLTAPRSRVRLYTELEGILCLSTDELFRREPELFTQLDAVRRYRNRFVHGPTDAEPEAAELPLSLPELFTMVSMVLELVEQQVQAQGLL